MKTILLLLSLISNFAMATTLRIPVAIRGENYISVKDFNQQFKLKDADKIPEYFIIENNLASIEKARADFWKLNEKIDSIKENKGFTLDITYPGFENKIAGKTCYIGNAAEAVDIAFGLADGIYSDQLSLTAWKFKNQVHAYEDSETKRIDEMLNENSTIWKNFKGTDETILIVSSQSDDGDDINEGFIYKCN